MKGEGKKTKKFGVRVMRVSGYTRVSENARESEIWKTVELEEKVHLFFAFSPYFCAIVGRCLSASLALM